MKRIATKTLMALAMMVLISATATPSVATPTLQFFQMGDLPNQEPAGAWFAFPTDNYCGLFHLYFIQGTDRNGPIYNPGGSFNLPLEYGTHDFTLLGSGGITGPEASLILNFAEGSFTIDTLHPNGSMTFGETTVTVTNFTFENYGAPGLTDRIGTCNPNPDGITDAVGHLTIEVSPTTIDLTGANVFDGYLGGYHAYPESQGCGIFHLYMIEGTDPNGTILNDNAPLSLSLTPGTHTFTLLGTEGPTSGLIDFNDLSSLPALTLNLSNGPDSGTLTVAHGATETLALGGLNITATQFTWTPYDQSSVNRVGTCGIGADPWNDAVGHLTLVVHSEASPPPPPPPSNGPIHLWSGEGNADDSVGNADGTLGGTTPFGTGLSGEAFYFDHQQSSIVSLPVDISPDALPQMTVVMFVKLDTGPYFNDSSALGWVFGHDNGGYDRSLNLHDTRYGSGVQVAGGTGVDPHQSTLPLTLHQWHCVAAAYDRDNSTVTFYADGATQTVYAAPGPGEPTASLGGLLNFGGHTIQGLVDEVSLFDRVLTPQEIDAISAQFPHAAPVANAGPDQTVEYAGDPTFFTLDGSGSYDPDGADLIYNWESAGSGFGSVSGVSTVGSLSEPSSVTLYVTDAQGNVSIDEVFINLVDTTPPVVTAPPAVIAPGPLTANDIGTATATDNSVVDVISSNAPATFPLGTTVVIWTATDVFGNSASATQNVTVFQSDTTPPVIALNGANPLLLELGTAYTEPGASALDAVDGDLTAAIQTSGGVDANTEGSYTVNYSVADAAGNTASASRTVQVLVTANSYGLIATHSLHLRQNARITSGFAGVVNQGSAPFLAGKVELVVGTRVQTDAGVRLSAPRVRVRQHADIDGQLVYNQLVAVGKHATIVQQTQVPANYFPLFQGTGLPVFLTSTPGTQDVEVKQKKSATLSPGAYDEISVKQKGTLTFAGGTYHLGDLDVGSNAEIRFLAPTTLLIRGQLSLDQNSTFGPASGSGIDASDLLVYVEGRNGRLGNGHDDDEGDDEEDDAEGRNLRKTPRAAKIGVRVSFQGNLYAPNGTIHLRQGSASVGSFIARDLIVGVRAQVAAQSGWNTPGVIYQPQAPAALAKLADAQAEAGTLPEGTGLLANYPNPFNPNTTIPYVLVEIAPVKLSVYNVLGQQIRVLVDQLQVPGSYTASWDGMDAAGIQAAGGVYFYRLEAGEHHSVMKMLFAK